LETARFRLVDHLAWRWLATWCVASWLSGAVAAAGSSGVVPAPELVGQDWLNLTPGTPMSLAARKGKVTVVHFWTFDCINCKHNLPFYNVWRQRFSSQGLEIIGVHTPETEAERNPANVAQRVKELGLTYPVLLDPKSENWRRWQQRVWPTVYLLDKQGRVRYRWEGELEYQGAGGSVRMARLIEELLKE
jgi:thiol-disulfide isomerase/thioredoxin